MQAYSLIWIGPILPHAEVLSLYSWVNFHLLQVGAMPLPSQSDDASRSSIHPLFDPEDALKIEFKLFFSGPIDAERFREAVWSEYLSNLQKVETYAISIVTEATRTTPKKLSVFDMDSTLIDQEVIDELGRKINRYDHISQITERAMRGEIDFKAAFFERVKLLKGLHVDEALTLTDTLTVSPGGERLLQYFKKQKVYTAVVSGGFQFILDHFKRHLQLDQVTGHVLLQDLDGNFLGEVELPVVSAETKRTITAELKKKFSFSPEQTLTVGDGANDMEMMKEAGLSVSFCGKPKLAAVCNTLILNRNLLWIKELLRA
jgi:phosphoserine phosphatase